MTINRRQISEGLSLTAVVPPLQVASPRCKLPGVNDQGQQMSLPLSDEMLSKHMLFLGEIGSGKTNAIQHIVAQLRQSMTPRDVMIIFDSKGDFYNSFFRPAQDIVISNDAKATGRTSTDYWNIFAELLSSETLNEDILEMTRSLFHERSERSSQPFFPNAARDLFGAIMLHFWRTDQTQPDNERLRSFLDHSSPADVRAVLSQHPDLRAMTSYIADDRSPQTQGVISELQQMVREIFVGNFRKQGKLSIRKSVRNKSGVIIFIEYDLGTGSVLTPIYRLLFDLAIKEALSRGASEGNVWFIVDEFRLLPNLRHVDDGVNFGRSLGAKFIIGIQNIEQVLHAYGEPLARSLLSGFLNCIAFRVNDPKTRMFIQDLYGKNRVYEANMSRVANKGLMEQFRDANVVEDWDILRLPVGKAIVGLPGYEPFFFQFTPYR